MFKIYAPKLHGYYESTMDSLHGWDTSGAISSVECPTVTYPHIDFANLGWGWCAITALGNYDPDKGGHLILWDLGLVICFPPGATIVIPSSLLRHSNVAIQAGETRFSFTQYTAAGIFRFVRNGFHTEKAVNLGVTTEEKRQRQDEQAQRWEEGLKMYQTWDLVFE
ncbi:hypothetical protein C8J57DRAFT_1439611 [Mycena rebaudengoi]|nr:hypothetical protein C8J57DRAFT_1439611 [Mycena rebaudengoi]